MSGNHITERQIRLYMKLRENFTQEVAASKASISVSTACRIEANRHQPKKDKRGWRTFCLTSKIYAFFLTFMFCEGLTIWLGDAM